jgi:hypothetical protein
MKRNFVVSLIIGISITITGYGCTLDSNNHHRFQDTKKESREVEKFSGIGLSVSAELILVQGTPQKVVLEGDAEDLEKIITELDGSTLEIKHKHDFSRIGKIKIYITVENIESLAISGSGSITSIGPVKSDRLTLAVSGSGTITLADLTAKTISSTVSGSGAIRMSGKNTKVDKQNITISGSGDVFAEDIESGVVKVSISGSGSCKVFASEKLDASVAGSGNVYYKGRAIVNANVAGSGKVRTIE